MTTGSVVFGSHSRLHPSYRAALTLVAVLTTVVSVMLSGCAGDGSNAESGDGAADDVSSGPERGEIDRSGDAMDCDTVEPAMLQLDVERRLSHDPGSYTQGLLIHDGVLYESSGLYQESSLRNVDLADGTTTHRAVLPQDVFAEGIAVTAEDELIQLTWKEGRAFRWDLDDFDGHAAPFAEFAYDGEGWGLTTMADGNLLMSDGSDHLVEREPSQFRVVDTHRVTRNGGPADMLNELEFDGTWLWANRYLSDELLRIEPRCFAVTGVADLGPLREEAATIAASSGADVDVANGIAFDPITGHHLVTGKLWPVTFEVTFSDRSD